MADSIEITVPVLNEEETLTEQICTLREYIDKNIDDAKGIDLVIADNGSTDKTPEIAKSLERDLNGVEYLRVDERGVGRALKASWTSSSADIVGYMDLDLATDLASLSPCLNVLVNNKADIVTGSRLAKGSEVIGRTIKREITSRGLNFMIKAYFGASFSDGMCGFKFLKKSILNNLMQAGAVSDGWFFSSEILITADTLNFKVLDVPVRWTDDPSSKVKITSLSIEYLQAMKKLKSQLRRIKKEQGA